MVLLCVLAVGAYYDFRRQKIPNWLILSGMAAGILTCLFVSKQTLEISMIARISGGFLLRMGLAVCLLFPLFYCRMIGGGDVKLIAVILGVLGILAGFLTVGAGLAIGAFWSLLKMILQGSLTKRLTYFTAYIRRIYLTRTITPYYNPGRDGREAVIPLCVCLFLGNLMRLIAWN